MIKRLLFLVIFISLCAAVYAQDTDIDNNEELDLPEIVIESGELQEFVIEVPLPEGPEMEAAIQAIPLPEYEVEVPRELEVILPDQEGIGIRPGTANQVPQYVFGRGTIGGGSLGYVHGAVEVKNLGEYPRFQFVFDYDSLDGFGGRSRGTGYDSSKNSISLDVDLADEANSFSFGASYDQSSKGLQGTGDVYEVSGHMLDSDLSYTRKINTEWSFKTDLQGSMYSRVPGATTAVLASRDARHENTRYLAEGQTGFMYMVDVIDLSMMFGYDFGILHSDTSSLEQSGDFILGMDIRPSQQWDISLDLGARYDQLGEFSFPCSADIVFSPINEFEFQIQGNIWNRRYADPFDSDYLGPVILFSDSLESYNTYDAGANMKYFFSTASWLSAGAEYVYSSKLPSDWQYIGADQGFLYDFTDAYRVNAVVAWDLELPLQFGVRGSYSITLAGQADLTGMHNLLAELNWHDANDTLLISGTVDFSNELLLIPKTDFSLNYRLTDDISVTMGVQDVFSIGTDRELFGPFVGPGFFGFAEINVSL